MLAFAGGGWMYIGPGADGVAGTTSIVVLLFFVCLAFMTVSSFVVRLRLPNNAGAGPRFPGSQPDARAEISSQAISSAWSSELDPVGGPVHKKCPEYGKKFFPTGIVPG